MTRPLTKSQKSRLYLKVRRGMKNAKRCHNRRDCRRTRYWCMVVMGLIRKLDKEMFETLA